MNIFEQAMRTQIEIAYGERTWDENPLIAIGLTQSILDLRLSDKQLFSAVKGYVRKLAMAVHPDVMASKSKASHFEEARARKVMVAFEFLDDEVMFGKALKEFRNLSAEDRQEINLVQHELNDVREQYEELLAVVGSASEIRASIQREQQAMAQERAQRISRMPSVLEAFKSAEKTIVQMGRESKKKMKKIDELQSYIEGARSYFLLQRYRFTLNRILMASEAIELSVLEFSFSKKEEAKVGGRHIESVPAEFRGACAKHIEMLEKLIPKYMRDKMFVQYHFNRFGISSGCIEDEGRERIIGSLDPEVVLGAGITQFQNPGPQFVLNKLRPHLNPGHLLISLRRHRLPPNLSTHEYLNSFPIRWKTKSFRASRIILAVK